MKVLYFHQHFTTPALGGATRSYEFARRLIERGHTVTMVCGEMACMPSMRYTPNSCRRRAR